MVLGIGAVCSTVDDFLVLGLCLGGDVADTCGLLFLSCCWLLLCVAHSHWAVINQKKVLGMCSTVDDSLLGLFLVDVAEDVV